VQLSFIQWRFESAQVLRCEARAKQRATEEAGSVRHAATLQHRATMSVVYDPMILCAVSFRADQHPETGPGRMLVHGWLEFAPTLDQAGWEIPPSSTARLFGVAGPRMKLARRFAAKGAMRTNVVIVSTPSLAFSPSFVETQEPVGVQAL
jgi:hypothetical protein